MRSAEQWLHFNNDATPEKIHRAFEASKAGKEGAITG